MALTDLETAIIVDLLVAGDDKAENIGRRTGYHRNTVSAQMKDLVGESLIEAKGGGVYRLTDKGRTTARQHIRSELDVYKRG